MLLEQWSKIYGVSKGPSSLSLLLIGTILSVTLIEVIQGNDLINNNLELQFSEHVKYIKNDLLDQATILESSTINYASAKLKESLFKSLRKMSESELHSLKGGKSGLLRQPRQEATEDADEEEGAEPSTVRTVPLIPVVANLLKAVFGGANGTSPLNISHTLQSAQNFILRPIGTPINAIGNILNINRGTAKPKTDELSQGSGSTDAAAEALVRSKRAIALAKKLLEISGNGTSPQDDPFQKVMKMNLTGEGSSSSGVGSGGFEKQNMTSSTSSGQNETEEGVVPGLVYIDVIAKDVQLGLDELLQAVPDLYTGAKEALGLFQNLREILDS